MERRLLVVDDDDDIREVASATLELLGDFIVVTAASGLEAIELATSAPPDAILLDVMMPGIDGPTTLARLREATCTAVIPVVFLTAKVLTAERERLEAMGAAGVIAKPFDPLTLSAELSEVLGWT